MKKTASYCIYIDEILFYLCTFSSGRKFRLSFKKAIKNKIKTYINVRPTNIYLKTYEYLFTVSELLHIK